MAILVSLICVVLLNLYAVALILLRARVYGVALYRPMLWNIALSFAPVLLAVLAVVGLLLLVPTLEVLSGAPMQLAALVVWIYVFAGTALWLLFFPNSVYLITELNFSHRADETPVPLWYDIVHTLALTLSGIANAVLSLAVVQTGFILIVIDPAAAEGIPASSWGFAAAVIALGAVGVYLGRYLRLNSWDVRHPVGLLRKLGAHFRPHGALLGAVGFVVTHAILIALVYVPSYAFAYGSLVG